MPPTTTSTCSIPAWRSSSSNAGTSDLQPHTQIDTCACQDTHVIVRTHMYACYFLVQLPHCLFKTLSQPHHLLSQQFSTCTQLPVS